MRMAQSWTCYNIQISGGFDAGSGWVTASCFCFGKRITMEKFKNITVNGVPLASVVAEEVGAEYRFHHTAEVNAMKFVATYSKSHNSASFRNHSGARTGRGRVIYSASVGGAA